MTYFILRTVYTHTWIGFYFLPSIILKGRLKFSKASSLRRRFSRTTEPCVRPTWTWWEGFVSFSTFQTSYWSAETLKSKKLKEKNWFDKTCERDLHFVLHFVQRTWWRFTLTRYRARYLLRSHSVALWTLPHITFLVWGLAFLGMTLTIEIADDDRHKSTESFW